jgi:hypothetical protein
MQAHDEWRQSGRHAPQVEPRHIWTLPDSDLRTLRLRAPRPAVVVGLPHSGRGYLAELLTSPFQDGTMPERLAADRPDFHDRLEALLASGASRPVVIADPDDLAPWDVLAGWLQRAAEAGLALRWVGGPRLAWQLAGDPDTALLLDGPFGMGPLTPAELEPWAARPLGQDTPPSAVSIPDADRLPLLELTGGLLPVLELFREWSRNSAGGLPDPLRKEHAAAFRDELSHNPARAGRLAERLAHGVPHELRVGLHHLFIGAHKYGDEVYTRTDLAALSDFLLEMGTEQLFRLIEAAASLGLLGDGGAAGRVRVPHASALGVLVRHERFAAP